MSGPVQAREGQLDDDMSAGKESAQAGPSESQAMTSNDNPECTALKNKRKQLRAKITRAINRLSSNIDGKEYNERRLKRILEEIKTDFSAACEVHGEMYNLMPEDNVTQQRMDKWEADLSDDVYDIEDKLSDYLSSLSISDTQPTGVVTRGVTNTKVAKPVSASGDTIVETPGETTQPVISPDQQYEVFNGASAARIQPSNGPNTSWRRFDSWIDELNEFQETVASSPTNEMTISEALFKLEASRDIPALKLEVFNGDPLAYVDFIERFKIHIHSKTHLNDDMRMVQLRMHTAGDAARAIGGLGSGGVFYATALKTLKDQFGQHGVITRACLRRLTKPCKISPNDRNGLRDLSLDIIHCLATFHRIGFCADADASENLRAIIKRLPDSLIGKWKSVVTEIREKGNMPSLEEVSNFVRKCVKVEFDPDFGDIERGGRMDYRAVSRERKKGIHAAHGWKETGKPTGKSQCYLCSQEHRVQNCPQYLDATVAERLELVKKHRLCFCCLVKGHGTVICRSKRSCGVNNCERTHHSTLHVDQPQVSGASSILDKNGILPVVRVNSRSSNGKSREENVLIDSGAGTTVIRRDFARFLGLQGKRERIDISVVGGERLEDFQSRRLKFWISPLDGGEEHLIEAHDIGKTIMNVPPLDRSWLQAFPHLKGIEFPHKAGPIDLILGVQYSHLHIDEDRRQGRPFEPIAKRTRLGWYVLGSEHGKNVSSICTVGLVNKFNIERFYAMETLGIQAPDCTCETQLMSKDDRKAMQCFEQTCTKEDSRYMIGLPWKRDPVLLPDNYSMAERRLGSLERSLKKNPKRAEMYGKAIDEYLDNGWAKELSPEERKVKPSYYLPHHGVYRPEKKSTPLRVVFDPACTFNGVSLNSCLYKGPGLIGNLLGVLLRFREGEVAFTGDISKMYLQIKLPEADTHVHRFLWRNMDTDKKPVQYRLMRVTFGDKPSPDMASFVILRIASEIEDEHPEAAAILRKDRYMDDIIHSCGTEQEAEQRMKELTGALENSGFHIKEWICGRRASEKHQSDSGVEDPSIEVSIGCEESVETLGIVWKPADDTIGFRGRNLETEIFTKRIVLSRISEIYDPLGLASAVTIRARVALQDIWRCSELGWDDHFSPEKCEEWRNLLREMEKVKNVEFPRCLRPSDAVGEPELHVFGDASVSAYGAVAYLVWQTKSVSEVRLVSAKARVSPLRQTTIPRLELMAALVASRLAKVIITEFKEKPTEVVLWTDSQIVLHWLKSDSITMKPFVGVRVSELQSAFEPDVWRYVPSSVNPADDLSRGLDVDQLSGRWMRGPAFLKDPKETWPLVEIKAPDHDIELKKTKKLAAIQGGETVVDASKFSVWSKLLRVTAYVLRFVNNIKVSVGNRDSDGQRWQGELQPEELIAAEHHWIVTVQRELGDWERQYKDLSPFLQDGLVRVGGRLRRSPLTYDQVHAVLLPGTSHLSKLLMRHIHQKMGHPGPERTLCESRRTWWITKGRRLSKEIVRSCVICRKLRQPAHTTLMADLPPERMQPFSPPFSVTGLDLFGPFLLKYGRNKSKKAWGAIFTCATTRAIHLEIVDGLSTQDFLHALRRFAAHHGWPSTVISDNGTSFVGTEKELKKLVTGENRKELQDYGSGHSIKWKFITPLSPHQGGLYESLIKQVKRAIYVAVGNQKLTWNEMSTVFAEVECLVNSRPIGFSSNSPDDFQPLTPNHFLLGRARADVPHGPFQETRNLNKRYEFVQALVFQFWKRFIREYVPTLMKRTKWKTKGRQVKVGDIVLLTDQDIPRGKWNLARVIQVHPGVDGIVRNLTVKTKSGEYRRSIQRCCLILESE